MRIFLYGYRRYTERIMQKNTPNDVDKTIAQNAENIVTDKTTKIPMTHEEYMQTKEAQDAFAMYERQAREREQGIDDADTSDTSVSSTQGATPETPNNNDEKKPGMLDELSMSQVMAGALAAVTSTFLASKIGIAGSLIGVAVASVVSTVASQVYKYFLKRSAEKLKDVTPLYDPDATKPFSIQNLLRSASEDDDKLDQTLAMHTPEALAEAIRNGTADEYVENEKRTHEKRCLIVKVSIAVVAIIVSLIAVGITVSVIDTVTDGNGIGTKPTPLFVTSTNGNVANSNAKHDGWNATEQNDNAPLVDDGDNENANESDEEKNANENDGDEEKELVTEDGKTDGSWDGTDGSSNGSTVGNGEPSNGNSSDGSSNTGGTTTPPSTDTGSGDGGTNGSTGGDNGQVTPPQPDGGNANENGSSSGSQPGSGETGNGTAGNGSDMWSSQQTPPAANGTLSPTS